MKYQNKNPFEKLHPGEPWFFLRTQDQLSTLILCEYKAYLVTNNAPSREVESIEALIQEFYQWQMQNRDKVKFPDSEAVKTDSGLGAMGGERHW